MIAQIILNIVAIFFVIVAVLFVKAFFVQKRCPLAYGNAKATLTGVSSVVRKGNPKKVSESIKGAEEALQLAEINDFSINDFFKSLHL